ncbi:hypothetical protein C1879_07840 [Paraeggerthella hongkongensis]|uniref:FAD-dependent oxidoreductase n=2 Tax=Eggerthellaceae TaxID=1643826 RepID=UPI000DF7835F|nr:FAD-dependent oxidoreductase [Paraeggerthella sp. Marseille-Q4926]RDB57134.1 hypothetical protein C1879_07840 [Paraeggerthella hongkongensis]
METISRRNFLTLGAMGAAGAAVCGLVGCAPQSAEKSGSGVAAGNGETINCSGIVVNPEEVTEVISTGIVIVGGGFAGLACAVQAAENGDDFILLEGQATLGGNGQGVEGTFAVDSRFQKEQNVSCDRSIIMQEELGKAQWCPDGLLYKDLIDASADNIEWLVDTCGCKLSGLIDNYPCGAVAGKVNSFHWWEDGAAYVGYVLPMQARLREKGADIRLNNRALEFSYDESGKVNGVYAIDAFGDLVQYQAQVVVLATGGFANDDRRLTKWGFNLETLERIGTPGHFGDGVNMALAAGAAEFSGVCYLKYNRISHQVEVFGPQWSAFAFGGPMLWVNEDCDRFVDESCALVVENVITQSAPIHNQNGHCFSVFDQAIYDKQIAQYNPEAISDWGVDITEQMEKIIAEGDDVWRADTLAAVAEKAGLDAAALQAAVDDYNAKCAAGVDDLYGKKAEYLTPIAQGPFYICEIHECMEGPLGGVRTDRKFRPVLEKGGVMENVFVIGLDGIMLYRDVYPMDVPGSASAECLNGGRSAANQAHDLLRA